MKARFLLLILFNLVILGLVGCGKGSAPETVVDGGGGGSGVGHVAMSHSPLSPFGRRSSGSHPVMVARVFRGAGG